MNCTAPVTPSPAYADSPSAAVPRCLLISASTSPASSGVSARTTGRTEPSANTAACSATTASARFDTPEVRPNAVRYRACQCPRPARSGASPATPHHRRLQLAASQSAKSLTGPSATGAGTVGFHWIQSGFRVVSYPTGNSASIPAQEPGRFDSGRRFSPRACPGTRSPAVNHVGVSPTCRHIRGTRL